MATRVQRPRLILPRISPPPETHTATQAATANARLALRAARPQASVALDTDQPYGRGGVPIPTPPYVDWAKFLPAFNVLWEVGEPDYPNPNVALVGAAGSGKTTLARAILQLRERVVVFGTKSQDPSLYGPFEKLGYKVKSTWDPRDTRNEKVIFKPPLRSADAAGLAGQREAFQNAMLAAFRYGGWTLYFDEVRYLSETLKLQTELDLLWLQGRSLGLVIVAGTQRPVSVPINMFEQSPHLFTWNISGIEDRRTMAGYTGRYRDAVVHWAPLLPKYEALYVNAGEGVFLRTRAARGAPPSN